MKKTLFLLLVCVTVSFLSACSSEDPQSSPLPEEVLSPETQFINRVYQTFGLNKEEYRSFSLFPELNIKDQSVVLSAMKEDNSKLVFAVYDSLQSNVLLCDSTFVLPTTLREPQYDEIRTYEIRGIIPSYYRTSKGGVGLARVEYSGDYPRYYTYFINGNKTNSLDYTNFSSLGRLNTFMEWGENAVLMQFHSNGYTNMVLDPNGKLLYKYKDLHDLREYSVLNLTQSDYLLYKFDGSDLEISRNAIKGNTLEQQWEQRVDCLGTYKGDCKMSISDAQIEGDTLKLQAKATYRNGEMRNTLVRINLATGVSNVEVDDIVITITD